MKKDTRLKIENFMILEGDKPEEESLRLRYVKKIGDIKIDYVEQGFSNILKIERNGKTIYQDGEFDNQFSKSISKLEERKISERYMPGYDLEIEVRVKKIDYMKEEDLEEIEAAIY